MKNLPKLPNSSRIGTFWGQKRDSNVISWIQKALVELRRYKIGETRIKFFSISDFGSEIIFIVSQLLKYHVLNSSLPNL